MKVLDLVAKVKSKDWFNAVISEKTIKEYHDLMQVPFMERDETLRLTYERHIATSVLAQYADKDNDNGKALDTNSPTESADGFSGSS